MNSSEYHPTEVGLAVKGAEPPLEILEMLKASGPHTQYRDKMMLFGQFVGDWDMSIAFFDEEGKKTYDQHGTWAFSWVLDGRAVQDVLVYPNPSRGMSGEAGERRIGSTMRWYDPNMDAWHVIWMGVVSGDLGVMVAREVDEEIWIEEKELDGSLTKWIFTEISQSSFRWKGTVSYDGGKSWKLDQEMFAKRRPSVSLNLPLH